MSNISKRYQSVKMRPPPSALHSTANPKANTACFALIIQHYYKDSTILMLSHQYLQPCIHPLTFSSHIKDQTHILMLELLSYAVRFISLKKMMVNTSFQA